MDVDVREWAVRDARAVLATTIRAPVATDPPLRKEYFRRLDRVLSLFPGAPSKKLVSRIYRDAFFGEIERVLREGAFWVYLNCLHEELAPLIITFTLFTYVLSFTSAVYSLSSSYHLFLVSAFLYPSILVALVLSMYILYLYVKYRKWLGEARALFAAMLEEWHTLGYILAPTPPPYEI